MLRLLSLLQTHRYWPGEELADRLEVSGRTLRRDIDRLRELGYAVDASRGVAGGYQLRAGGSLPPLLLEDEEAVAIAVGLRTAAAGLGRRAGGDVGAGADQGDRADAAEAAAADGRAEVADRVAGSVGRGPDGRCRRTHHAGAGLPRRRAAEVRLHRARRQAHPSLGRAAPAGVAGPPLVPRRLRPRPAGLALLPARPDPQAGGHRAALPSARPPRRGRADVRAVRHPADAAALPGAGADRGRRRRRTTCGRAVGRSSQRGRGPTRACW